MDLGRAVSYVRQVAGGLDYAFRSGIIHRDIKPGNILIDRRGPRWLLTWGWPASTRTTPTSSRSSTTTRSCWARPTTSPPSRWRTATRWTSARRRLRPRGRRYYFLLAGHPPFPDRTRCRRSCWAPDEGADADPRRSAPRSRTGAGDRRWQDDGEDPKARFQTPAQVAAELEAVFVPASVPLPAAEEMPTLSPAASEARAGTRGAGEAAAPLPRPAPGRRRGGVRPGRRRRSSRPLALSPFAAADGAPAMDPGLPAATSGSTSWPAAAFPTVPTARLPTLRATGTDADAAATTRSSTRSAPFATGAPPWEEAAGLATPTAFAWVVVECRAGAVEVLGRGGGVSGDRPRDGG